MPGKFHHEQLYRGQDLIDKLSRIRITICGAGALGSHLADNLARQGAQLLRVIDHDRIEEHNVSTQIYGESDIGGWKVDALRNRIFLATGVEIDALRKELAETNARQLLKDSELLIDTFDNSKSRQLVQHTAQALGVPCLHAGLNADYGEVIWDERYRVPREVAGDVCDYPLARNLVLITVAIATEIVLRFAGGAAREDWSITLADFAARRCESS